MRLVHLREEFLGSLLVRASIFQDLNDSVEFNVLVGFLGILEESHGDLEKFEFVDLFDDLQFELDRLSEGAASWTSQGEVGIDDTVIGNSLIVDVQGNSDLVVGERFDLKIDWDVHGAEHLGSLVGEVASDGATWFVRPVGVVSHLDLSEDGLTGRGLKDFLWDVDDLASVLLVDSISVTVASPATATSTSAPASVTASTRSSPRSTVTSSSPAVASSWAATVHSSHDFLEHSHWVWSVLVVHVVLILTISSHTLTSEWAVATLSGVGGTSSLGVLVRAWLAIKANSLSTEWHMCIGRASCSLTTVLLLRLTLWIASHKLVSKLSGHVHDLVNIDVGLRILHVFINNSDDGLGSLARVGDLQEGVLVASSLFTSGAEVEIFANTTLVPDSNDGCHAAAITLNSLVDNLLLIVSDTRRRNLAFNILLSVGVKIVHNLSTLFVELFLDEFLKCLLWKTGLLSLWLLVLGPFLFHLLVDLDLLLGVRRIVTRGFHAIILDGILDCSLNVIGADWNLFFLDLLFLRDIWLHDLERLILHDWLLGLLSRLHHKLDLVVHGTFSHLVSNEEILIVRDVDDIADVIGICDFHHIFLHKLNAHFVFADLGLDGLPQSLETGRCFSDSLGDRVFGDLDS